MSKKSLNMEMGNLICKFGQNKVLLDLADEIVFPSFFDTNLIRSYDKTRYFFHDVKKVILNDDENNQVIGIAGRFIKDTTLQREQIFEQERGLIKDTETMRSSPSAIFLLILNYHRLIYVREMSDAPTKETFKSTLLNFLREKHKNFINSEYETYKNLSKSISSQQEIDSNMKISISKLNALAGRTVIDLSQKESDKQLVTKKLLLEIVPYPSLELIPLTTTDSIEDFIKKYDVLKTLEISLFDRNDENDNEPFFEELQKRKDKLGSHKSTLKHTNSKGLKKDVAIHEISEATAQGNQSVKLQGIDLEGDILSGNNEKFQIRKSIDDLSDKPEKAAKELYQSFNGLVKEGLIKLPETSEKVINLINNLAQKLTQ